MMHKSLLLVFVLLVVLSSSIYSQTTTITGGEDKWYNPNNGHYYAIFFADGPEGATFSWIEAAQFALTQHYNGRDGHLVTITSQTEANWFGGMNPFHDGGWIGAANDSGSWVWITGREDDETGTPVTFFYPAYACGGACAPLGCHRLYKTGGNKFTTTPSHSVKVGRTWQCVNLDYISFVVEYSWPEVVGTESITWGAIKALYDE